MTNDQKEYLRSNICFDTLEDLCTSINAIGPYVFGVPIDTPISINRFGITLVLTHGMVHIDNFSYPKSQVAHALLRLLMAN